eukprot:TRINITY_DN6603_c0_g2_i1.p1 TRINITY_DN6603_c0_g2~~TRINITY_DN6603_c0_g2_i1.p1  ORF type:complete len:857 (+),score=173.94 TRINITY_DN6603_c0_g2_i1:82-2652(+)
MAPRAAPRSAALLLAASGASLVLGVRIGDADEGSLAVNDTVFVDEALRQAILARQEGNCKDRLKACGFAPDTFATYTDILCAPQARYESTSNWVREAYREVLKNWNKCFKGTAVPHMNIFYMVMDEVVVDIVPPGEDAATHKLKGSKSSLRMPIGDGVKGAWGATEGLLEMLQPRHNQVESIIGKWSAAQGADPSGFRELSGKGEFPWMYTNAIVGGLQKLGFSLKDIESLPVNVNGYRVRMMDSEDLNMARQKFCDKGSCSSDDSSRPGGAGQATPGVAGGTVPGGPVTLPEEEEEEGEAQKEAKPSATEMDDASIKEVEAEAQGGLTEAEIQQAVKTAFSGGEESPAVILSSGSRWDAWAEDSRGYASAGAAANVQWKEAKAQISICYSHQSNAHQHPQHQGRYKAGTKQLSGLGEVAPHSWEVGARPNFVSKDYRGIFDGQPTATLSYVHFDEVIQPPEDGVEFIGNPHTKYEGMVYPTAVTTQGHPEVPLIYDIAMIASCSLWKYFYPNSVKNGETLPEGYCEDAYLGCASWFGKQDLWKSTVCLEPMFNDGFKTDKSKSNGHHTNADLEVPDGDMVPGSDKTENEGLANEYKHKEIPDVQGKTSFEKDCTKCFGNVQWNQLMLLVKNVFDSKKCTRGKESVSKLTEKLRLPGSASEEEASPWDEIYEYLSHRGGAHETESIEEVLNCGDALAALSKDHFTTEHDNWKEGSRYDARKTDAESRERFGDSSLLQGSPAEVNFPKADEAFHYLNKCTWGLALLLKEEDEACFADTLADILPDARKVAELWVRNIVTTNLRLVEDGAPGSKGGAPGGGLDSGSSASMDKEKEQSGMAGMGGSALETSFRQRSSLL